MSKRRITVEARLQGGLGNQLFQIAAAIQRVGDTSSCLRIRATKVHPIALECLNNLPRTYSVEVVQLSLRHKLVSLVMTRVSPLPIRIFYLLLGYRLIFQSAKDAYGPAASDLGKTVGRSLVMQGYFQHHAWHGDSIEKLAKSLRVLLEAHPVFHASKDSTAISLRRGDYVPANWALPLQYYKDSVSYLGEKIKDCLVVGDDSLCSETFTAWLQQRGISASWISAFEDWELHDLAVMAGSRNVVMSNSTFCWWAVMAKQDLELEGVIVAPKPWLPNFQTEGLSRNEWHPVNVCFSEQPPNRPNG